MIVYYAVGGGLGHLTRGRRILEHLGLAHDAAIVTASPYAWDVRVTGGIAIIEVPAQFEQDVEAHRAWMRGLDAARIIVDTFPGGIHGELCGLDVPMDLVARLVRWDEYRRAVPDPLPCFETAWLMEELEPEHDAFVRENSGRQAILPVGWWISGQAGSPVQRVILSPAEGEGPSGGPRRRSFAVYAAQDDTDNFLHPFWLIVHSGPENEVRELVEYTSELRALAAEAPARILVATRSATPLPDGFETIDTYPATTHFPHAERIISAAGFNVMLETEPWRHKHEVIPFARRFDDQYRRAARRRASR